MTRIAGWRIAPNESGTQEVYVRPFPGPGRRGQVSMGGVRKFLLDVRLEVSARRSRYQVAANGQKFLVAVPLESAQSAPVTVVTNWTAGLKQ